jgi:EmrB/QacA subfamily drug resistance transporter
VVWVTSAYLLGFAVVLLLAGRLGDRFGAKNFYLIGLLVFTIASLWCGLSTSAAMLIAARVVQGVGAGVLTPQTLSIITRIFPPQKRGIAMSVWGTTAGVASVAGPLAGGALVDGLGWNWIFFVNIPVGIAGLALAMWLVPVLSTQAHGFDLIGAGLSGVGIFLIVFGLQEGQAAHWQPWIWALIVAGIGCMSAFVSWQSVTTGEPLIPLEIFKDRDFSLSSIGVGIIAFASTGMLLPLTFLMQAVSGLSPTRSALVLIPMAVPSVVLAPRIGRIVDRHHPRPVLGFGFSMLAIGLTWLSFEMADGVVIWRLLLPSTLVGLAGALVWSPLAATATRNLPLELAGVSSAVYNSVRQLGAVLGSAAMAAFMTWRIGAEVPQAAAGAAEDDVTLRLPESVREPFSAAMSQSMLLPAFIALFGIVAALFLIGFTPSALAAGWGRQQRGHHDDAGGDDYDDDDYVEFILRREPDAAPIAPADGEIGLAHNGIAVDGDEPLRRIADVSPRRSGSARRAGRPAPPQARRRGGTRHHRDPDDDPTSTGRRSPRV